MIKNREETIETIINGLEGKDLDLLYNLLGDFQPADVAEIIAELDPAQRGDVFELLDEDTAALVLDMLDTPVISSLFERLTPSKLAVILNEMSSDDAADLLGGLPEGQRESLLGLMQTEEADDIQELLEYDSKTAGGIMATEYVAVPQDISTGRAIEVLRETAPDAETVYYVYVVDKKNRLVGVITLRELIVTAPETPIEEIMHRNVISVSVDMDQEDVAEVVSKYNFLAVPVIDKDNSLLGIVTVDDIIDVIYEEATEDFFLLGGSTEPAEDGKSFLVSALQSRLPWLLITMVEGLLAGRVLHGLERELSAVVALAFFIPLLTGMGGNVGTQSATIAVRGLATGQIETKDVFRISLREAGAGTILGMINGGIVALVAYFWQNNFILGLIVGLAMVGNMTTAALMGTLVPIFFKRVGIDPAVASAPFITASIDITGLLIYSALASMLIGFLL